MVLNQGEKHPTLGRNVVVGVIKHALSAHTEVLPASKIVLNLTIPADKGGTSDYSTTDHANTTSDLMMDSSVKNISTEVFRLVEGTAVE